ncbi:alpha/beta-hydrolase [Desarmillaria tabescens]|uniref:Alpha/beta-hydrolase n=1 Tax=Armillaria tabescens TaxID=1929756 RepID=A0AA39K5T0_ARMTA|nr:alpha/beta-hydrolase [Desarmillaria tabescens]KAK0452773.1 alpha/beta-hydrolase [Desarmillaria tabescens]
MLTSTLLFVFLFQLFAAVRTAPVPFDFGGHLNNIFGGEDDNSSTNDEDSSGFFDGLLDKAEDAVSEDASDLLKGILGDDDSASSNTTTSTVSVSSTDLTAAFSRPAFFSRIAYCSSASVESFSCGAPCDALEAESVDILATGGDGGTIPKFVIAHDKSTNSIVVAHQGTDPENILSILNDADLVLTPIDTESFPSAAGKGIEVHSGFLETFSRTASTILSTVKSALSSTGADSVVLTGHSLGSALAMLDALMFNDALANVSIQTTTFGSPRVGNQAFADFADTSLSSGVFARMTNKADPVPHLPPIVLDFVHPQGEVHLGDAGAVLCERQENKSEACADGEGLLAITDGVGDHLGPYFDGISFGLGECSA